MVIPLINDTKIILISGKSNSGKGTVATIIKQELEENPNYNVIQCSLSTYIRNITKNDFYWDGNDTPKSRKFMAEVYHIGTEFYPYHMMRRVWERDIEPKLVKNRTNIAIVESFREKVNYDYCLILKKLKKISDIITLRVVRPDYDVTDDELKQHISENDLDDFDFDWYIVNDCDIKELKSKIKLKLNDIKEK